jgi:hypothetical protein
MSVCLFARSICLTASEQKRRPAYYEGTAWKMEMPNMQTLKDTELPYRHLFEDTQKGILILDVEMGMIEDVNPC